MTSDSLSQLREIVREKGRVDVKLDVDYAVWHSTLQGNYPYNSGLRGEIEGIPVRLRFTGKTVPNTFGTFPVSDKLEGTIGDCKLEGRFTDQIVFSAIVGNVPVNDGIVLKSGDKEYKLRFKISRAQGAIRNAAGGGGGKKVNPVGTVFKRGKLMDASEVKGSGGKTMYEAAVPIISELHGMIEDMELCFKFTPVYFTDTDTRRTPVNRHATGYIKYAG
ncbi:MAG: hypothetical protein P9L94_02815 [Candidatus Hinthialibacter antarcticus]|nr:hypothetical protein [Candidatus Hinthialibacter antarcticus]